jgi:hypothetical protein
VITRESEHRETVGDDEKSFKSIKTFGLPTILEFTRVLISLINPHDLKHTDSLHRSLALRLATKALEVGGCSLAKWVAAGFEIDTITVEDDDSEINIITTDQPGTVVSLGANGASYATEAKEEEEDDEPHVTEIAPTEEKANEEHENDYRKIAVKIKHMVVDDFCKHLLKLLLIQNTTRSQPPTQITLKLVPLITRAISTLFSTMGKLLLPQKGWFLKILMDKLSMGVNTQGLEENQFATEEINENVNRQGDILDETIRELYLDTLLQICRSDTLFTELYIYYDTSIALKDESQSGLNVYYDDGFFSSNFCLFEELIKFFTRFTIPDLRAGGSVTKKIHQDLAFDGLHIFLRCLYERRNLNPSYPVLLNSKKYEINHEPVKLTAPMLLKVRERKDAFFKGAEVFNVSAKKGLKYFQGILKINRNLIFTRPIDCRNHCYFFR